MMLWSCVGVYTFEAVTSSRFYKLTLVRKDLDLGWGTLEHAVTLVYWCRVPCVGTCGSSRSRGWGVMTITQDTGIHNNNCVVFGECCGEYIWVKRLLSASRSST